MFQRQGNKEFCQIHPDVEAIQGAAKTKKGWRLVKTCPACDQLVEELKKEKVTSERFSKMAKKKAT